MNALEHALYLIPYVRPLMLVESDYETLTNRANGPADFETNCMLNSDALMVLLTGDDMDEIEIMKGEEILHYLKQHHICQVILNGNSDGHAFILLELDNLIYMMDSYAGQWAIKHKIVDIKVFIAQLNRYLANPSDQTWYEWIGVRLHKPITEPIEHEFCVRVPIQFQLSRDNINQHVLDLIQRTESVVGHGAWMDLYEYVMTDHVMGFLAMLIPEELEWPERLIYYNKILKEKILV